MTSPPFAPTARREIAIAAAAWCRSKAREAPGKMGRYRGTGSLPAGSLETRSDGIPARRPRRPQAVFLFSARLSVRSLSYEYPVISQLRGAASTRNPRAAAFIQCLEVASPIPNAFVHNLRHCLSVCLTDSKTHKFTSRFS